MNLMKSIKKAKRKQLLITAGISIVSCIVLMGLLAFGVSKMTVQNYNKLNQRLFNYNTIASPNINIDSQAIQAPSIFGGEVVTNQSKNIDGYIVPWSTLRSKYSVFGNAIDENELIPSWYHSSQNAYQYNRQTKQKVATFYHPAVKEYYDEVKNELASLDPKDNAVAEVALSFDKPYTYDEVKGMLPQNVNIVWLYLFSEEGKETTGPHDTEYGIQLNLDERNEVVDAERDKKEFFKAFEAYFSSTKDSEVTAFIKENKSKKIDDIKVLGVMVTGKVKNLVNLKDEPFIRGSSIGVTVPTVSYITPEK